MAPRFNLSRWFAFTALASIAALATVIGLLLNNFLTARMLAQEASLTQEFVNSLLVVGTPLVRYTAEPALRREGQPPEAFDQLTRIPDVLRTNLYDREQKQPGARTCAGRRGRCRARRA
jgi:two-component system, NtrC family, sensor histidine kinase HydH